MSTFNQNKSVVNIQRKLCLDDLLLFFGQVKLDVLRNGNLSTLHLPSPFLSVKTSWRDVGMVLYIVEQDHISLFLPSQPGLLSP